MEFDELPRDVQLRVLSRLDIDARRALGVYTRLRVPPSLAHRLGQACIRRLTRTDPPPPPTAALWIVLPPACPREYVRYVTDALARGSPGSREGDRRLLLTVASYMEAMGDADLTRGTVINAGVAEGVLHIGLGQPEPGDQESLLIMYPMWMTPEHMVNWGM